MTAAQQERSPDTRRRYTRWSEAEWEELARLAGEGLGYRKIARRMGRPEGSVIGYLNELRNPGFLDAESAKRREARALAGRRRVATYSHSLVVAVDVDTFNAVATLADESLRSKSAVLRDLIEWGLMAGDDRQ